MIQRKSKLGFTLIEIVIATTLFALIGVTASEMLINTLRDARRIKLERNVYLEAQFLIQTIRDELTENTLDYNEYYSRKVLGAGNYGENIGVYGEQFYNEEDYNTGQHYYAGFSGGSAEDANALCNLSISSDCPNAALEGQNELYLINEKGNLKTIYALESRGIPEGGTEEEFTLAMVRLEGSDSDEDGVIDFWQCDPEFFERCSGSGSKGNILPDLNDLTDGTANDQNFVPITTSSLNIKELKFLIYPLEDPKRAFMENEMIYQPEITLVLTVEPSAALTQNILGEIPVLTLEETISSEAYPEVGSF